MISKQLNMEKEGVVNSHRKSRENVTNSHKARLTKLGSNQKLIIHSLKDADLSFTELMQATGLGRTQAVEASRQLVDSNVLEYVWSKDGRAVYRLKGK